MRVIYFAHDLNDPAVARRVAMLRAAGSDIMVAGFWRGTAPPCEIEGAPALGLARTVDGRLLHRAAVTLGQALCTHRLRELLGWADVLMARNLEMLAIACAARRRCNPTAALVYEVLDIHRLLASSGPASRGLRAIEAHLLRNVDLLIVSSPAFLREYFAPRQRTASQIPTALVENKVFAGGGLGQIRVDPPPGPPWCIGWLGVIRCGRSLSVLSSLAQRRPDLVRIEIHGRPTRGIAEVLERETSHLPALTFGGPYSLGDLPRLYGRTHFSWAVDYFEEGANSRWLLPNRIYEAGRYDAVSLAIRGTETARWLEARGLGVLLDAPEYELEAVLDGLAPSDYATLKAGARRAERSHFEAGPNDCNRLGQLLRAAKARRRATADAVAVE